MRIGIKIILFCLIPIVLLIIGVLYITDSQLRTTAARVANHVMEEKLSVEMEFFRSAVDKYYGRMALKGGKLVDGKGVGLAGRYDVIDQISSRFSSTATIFGREGNDFIRVVTTVKKDDGSRAVGTSLDRESKAYQHIINGEGYVGEANILDKPYLTRYEPIRNANGALIGILYAGIPKNNIAAVINEIFGHSMLWISLTMAGLVVCIAVLIAVVVWRSLSPMQEIVQGIRELGKGHVSHRVRIQRNDEIGVMASAMNQFAEDLQHNIVDVLRKVAEGDVSTWISAKDDKDEIAPALINVHKALNGLITDTKCLTAAALKGQLDVRGNVNKYRGSYRTILQEMNETLNAVIHPINEAADVMAHVSEKDLTVRIQGDYQGDHAKIKNSLNLAIDNLAKALHQVTLGANQVGAASSQVSIGGQALAQSASA